MMNRDLFHSCRTLIGKTKALLHRSVTLRRALILAWHIAGIYLTYYLAFCLRFDGRIPAEHWPVLIQTHHILALICIPVFAVFHLYSGIWAYFSIYDLIRIALALVLSLLLFTVAVYFRLGQSFIGFPRSVLFIEFLLLGFWMAGGRVFMRWLRERRTLQKIAASRSLKNALLVGSLGDVDHLLRSVPPQSSGIGHFVGILSDEPGAEGLSMRGIRVEGSVSQAGRVARQKKAGCILILPPYTRPAEMKKLVASCEAENAVCEFRMLPSMQDLASGRIELSNIRKVEIEDLLGRPEITFDRQAVKESVENKVVMITGAGGSIGSELARQICQYHPKTLVVLDIGEYNLYSIDMELRRLFPYISLISVAGDVGDVSCVRNVLTRHKVQVVYHAAAYKHVPIMEINVPACLENNTLGTASLAAEAEEAGVERFVLISTDKAVRPTSVMGSSKRLAERILQERPVSKTIFVTVRFGNVLGSSGSVIPLFRRQIQQGGPVTVTSEKATRFFMSIPEAVDLLLQASVVGRDRDIMVLEMGESIRVVDMARHLIELSGLKVGEDIDIVFTGLRPGEKEFEEIMTDGENVVRTPFEKIWVMNSDGNHTAPPVDPDRISRLVATRDEARLREELVRLIPEADPAIRKT